MLIVIHLTVQKYLTKSYCKKGIEKASMFITHTGHQYYLLWSDQIPFYDELVRGHSYQETIILYPVLLLVIF
jgi:hypothetical protein